MFVTFFCFILSLGDPFVLKTHTQLQEDAKEEKRAPLITFLLLSPSSHCLCSAFSWKRFTLDFDAPMYASLVEKKAIIFIAEPCSPLA